MDKENLKLIGGYMLLVIIAYIIISKITSKVGSGISSIASGDIFKSDAERATDLIIQAKNAQIAGGWVLKEKSLPLKERTKITKDTAMRLADDFHIQFRQFFQLKSTEDEIFALFQKIPTTGSLYYIFDAFGIRDGMDFNQYAIKSMGNSSILQKDLGDVNKMFKNKGINYVF